MRKMALKSKYPEVIIPDNLSWPDFVFKHFEGYGSRTAVVCSWTKSSYTFSEVKDLSRKFASALSKRGIRKGDVVAISAANVPEFAIVFLGVLQLGGVVTGVNPHFTSEELTNQLKEANAKCIVTDPHLVHRAKEAAKKLGIDHVFVIGEDEDCVSVSDLLKEDESRIPHVTLNPHEDLAFLPFSTGTSGLPKGVMVTHYNLIALGCIVNAGGFLDFKENSKILALVPFYRAFGMIAVLSLGLHHGSTLISVPRFDHNKLFHLLQDYKVTHLATEASVVHLLSKHSAVEKFDLTSLTEVISSASSLSEETSRNVMKRMPQLRRVNQCYGMTECTTISHMTPSVDSRHGSVGVLLPNLECKVSDAATGQSLGAGKRGEICIRGPTVMKGYLNNRESSDQMIDSDGWLHTGDVGYYDKEEHFFIVDKLKDLIKFRGHQVSPSELESLLRAHPAIEDAAVIGVTDPEVGELPMAYIVSKNEDELTEIEIAEYVDENAAPHKKLRGGVAFIAAIPKSANGHVLRAELKEMYKREKTKVYVPRRGSLFGNEDKRSPAKRHSIMGPYVKARDHGTIAEEKEPRKEERIRPRNAVRSQSCVLL